MKTTRWMSFISDQYQLKSERERWTYLMIGLALWVQIWLLFGLMPLHRTSQTLQLASKQLTMQLDLADANRNMTGKAGFMKHTYPYGTNTTPLMQALLQSGKNVHLDNVTNMNTDHTLEMNVHGSYFEILAFLQRLEQLPWCLSWDKLQYQVAAYPEGKVSMTLHAST